MSKHPRRAVTGLVAAALGFSGVLVATPTAHAAAPAECVAPTTSVRVLSFNDFHGRIDVAARLFTAVEQIRADVGEGNVLLLSNGDSIGGSTFVSAVAQDTPTLDILNAAGVEASATGNHEYDLGWADLSGRVIPAVDFPYLAANVYDTSGAVALPLQAYATFEKGDLTVAVGGAVTGDLPSLVSPAGISGLTIGDPVTAVNRVAAQLKDGDPANGEADVVIAQIHEGAPVGTLAASANAAASPNFAAMYEDLDAEVDVIFNGHTHQPYQFETTKGQPIVQASAYGTQLQDVELFADANGYCGATVNAPVEGTEADASFPRIAEIQRLYAAAEEAAAVRGAEVIGTATAAISTPGAGNSSTRDQESPMTNAVAQMFYDQMRQGDPEFIGVQNPGGTRTSFDAGDITYEEAALVLPFANSLWTTELTGAQFKEVLEQQWQRDRNGAVPSRPYLALGLSDNVSYTFDETRPEGDRITSITINGRPIDAEKRYTVGSGSFLISGGDNFHAFAEGTNTRDFGLVDLTAFVDWVREQGTLSPDYSKRGVSVQGLPEVLPVGEEVTFTVGAPGEVYRGTLDMVLDETGERVSPRLPNATLRAYLGDTQVGGGEVVDGVAQVSVTIPEDTPYGVAQLRFEVDPSNTIVYSAPLLIEGVKDDDPEPTPSPSAEPSASPSATPRRDGGGKAGGKATVGKTTVRPGLPRTGA